MRQNATPEAVSGRPTAASSLSTLGLGPDSLSGTPCLMRNVASSAAETAVDAVVPHAAPATPICGKGPIPHISIGSSRALSSTETTVILSAADVTPIPLMPLSSTMAAARGAAPRSDATRYSVASVAVCDPAPRPSQPQYVPAAGMAAARRAVVNAAPNMPCTSAPPTASMSPLPAHADTLACVPSAAREHSSCMIHRANDVAPMAARGAEPGSLPIQKASVRA
mmetsp:Transcript_21184/g.72173  ORF Transcript_21184/g.72173 Transcript_21184/m.72173 type:complete len:224 (+) Transcript_21184:631-1302(+)